MGLVRGVTSFVSSTANTVAQKGSTAATTVTQTAASTVEATRSVGTVVVDQFIEAGKALQPHRPNSAWSKPTPVINQHTLPGGDTKCGGAVGAMLLRAAGHSGSPTQLMNQYLGGGSDMTFRGISRGLEEAGLKTFPIPTVDSAAWTLNQGGKVVAQVHPSALGLGDSDKPHYVLLDGLDSQGNFLAIDPGSGKVHTLKHDELGQALVRAQVGSLDRNSGMMAVFPPNVTASGTMDVFLDVAGALPPWSNAVGSGGQEGGGTKEESLTRPTMPT